MKVNQLGKSTFKVSLARSYKKFFSVHSLKLLKYFRLNTLLTKYYNNFFNYYPNSGYLHESRIFKFKLFIIFS